MSLPVQGVIGSIIDSLNITNATFFGSAFIGWLFLGPCLGFFDCFGMTLTYDITEGMPIPMDILRQDPILCELIRTYNAFNNIYMAHQCVIISHEHASHAPHAQQNMKNVPQLNMNNFRPMNHLLPLSEQITTQHPHLADVVNELVRNITNYNATLNDPSDMAMCHRNEEIANIMTSLEIIIRAISPLGLDFTFPVIDNVNPDQQ